MGASQANIKTVRRRTGEMTEVVYDDAALAALIEAHPLPDGEGRKPDHDEWVETYDLWAAAGDVWLEKAAALAGDFDFTADGASFSRSQAYEMAKKQAAYCMSRRAAKGVDLTLPIPEPSDLLTQLPSN